MSVDQNRSSGLTRIRPNFWAFQEKCPFFGSNPFEFNSGAVKIGVMVGILPGAGRQNNPKLPFCLITPAPPGYFSLAVERFEMTHAPILTSFSPDFSGQKWTLRKSSGGQNGWGHTSDANSEFTRKLWRAKKFRAVSSVVERLVYTERVGGSKPSPPISFSEK